MYQIDVNHLHTASMREQIQNMDFKICVVLSDFCVLLLFLALNQLKYNRDQEKPKILRADVRLFGRRKEKVATCLFKTFV